MSDQPQMADAVRTLVQDGMEAAEQRQAFRNQRAMRFALRGPLARPAAWACLCCSFVARGATDAGIQAAMDAHARYVNAHGDRATDPHFEDVRMDALLSA